MLKTKGKYLVTFVFYYYCTATTNQTKQANKPNKHPPYLSHTSLRPATLCFYNMRTHTKYLGLRVPPSINLLIIQSIWVLILLSCLNVIMGSRGSFAEMNSLKNYRQRASRSHQKSIKKSLNHR